MVGRHRREAVGRWRRWSLQRPGGINDNIGDTTLLRIAAPSDGQHSALLLLLLPALLEKKKTLLKLPLIIRPMLLLQRRR